MDVVRKVRGLRPEDGAVDDDDDADDVGNDCHCA